MGAVATISRPYRFHSTAQFGDRFLFLLHSCLILGWQGKHLLLGAIRNTRHGGADAIRPVGMVLFMAVWFFAGTSTCMHTQGAPPTYTRSPNRNKIHKMPKQYRVSDATLAGPPHRCPGPPRNGTTNGINFSGGNMEYAGVGLLRRSGDLLSGDLCCSMWVVVASCSSTTGSFQ